MRIFTVDSFTNTPFKGNPAGVCVLENKLTDSEYIEIAQEINLSETAFVYLEDDKYQLKWFTPINEVDLCGHATLATAKVLFDKYSIKQDIIEFNTKSGILTARKVDDRFEMNFPIGKLNTFEEKDEILETFLNDKPIAICTNKDWCVIELANDESVINFKPNLNLLLTHNRKLFVITAKSTNNKYDFISRVFGPAVGVDEDPVTGSAHCYLARYWGGKLSKKLMIGYQASKRGGVIECEIIEKERVLLRGNCVIMSELLFEWND